MKAIKTLRAMSLVPATLGLFGLGLAVLPGCSTTPPNQEAKKTLSTESHAALDAMLKNDPSIQHLLDKAYAHAIFPGVVKGAAIVGGSNGRGEVYEGNKFIGYADLSQASIGAQVGGVSYDELIVFEKKEDLDKLINDKMTMGANASAVIVKSGAGDATSFVDGIAVIIQPKGGAMVDASVGGQTFHFVPATVENQ